MIAKSKRGSVFVNIIAIIGAVLIFVGVAWLIARNWHQIPDILKVMILVVSTLAAFISGFFLKQSDYEGTGRALITLGALLYILSLFLISQIYHLATTIQHYTWLLFLAWTLIFITAYFLYSPENLVLSMIIFFPWVILRYSYHLLRINLSSSEGVIFGLILIFLSIGVLLYGLSVLHNSLNHRFTNIYRFWTVFYFLLIFYILSFQSILPIISELSFERGTFTIFLVSFIILCFLGFIISVLFGVSKEKISIKEILGFLTVLCILLALILSTKAGAGLVGVCYPKDCYEFKTISSCASVPDPLVCEWKTYEGTEGSCERISCYNYQNESGCVSAPSKLNCIWQNNYCREQRNIVNDDHNNYQKCVEYNNQKSKCLEETSCKWMPSYNIFYSIKGSLPTVLWFLWIVINFVFIGFIILVLWYGQFVNSRKIINLGLLFFILEIFSRYIGFWFDFKGYVAFSILAILGGIMLILGSLFIPKWRRNLLEKTIQNKGGD